MEPWFFNIMPAPSQVVFFRIAGAPSEVQFSRKRQVRCPRQVLKSRQYKQLGWANGEYYADEVFLGSRGHRRLGSGHLGHSRLGAPSSKNDEHGQLPAAVGVILLRLRTTASGRDISFGSVLDRGRRQSPLWVLWLLRQSARTRSGARPNIQSGMVMAASCAKAIGSGPAAARSFFSSAVGLIAAPGSPKSS
jgi:hypothetical protein